VKAASLGTPLVRYGSVLKVADDLWSVWVRAASEACVVCGRPFPPQAMQCAHGLSRDEKAVRFEPLNTFAACAPCHRRNTPAGPDWFDWMRAFIGEANYRQIRYRAQAGGKLRLSDLQLVILDAQSRINALPAGERREWALERAEAITARLFRLGVAA
jgi:hypothetical protein